MTEQRQFDLSPPDSQYEHTKTKRELLTLGYESFGDSQGSQPLQAHVIQAVVRRMLENNYGFGLSSLTDNERRMDGKRPPNGHKDISTPDQAAPQLKFWWRNMTTIITTTIDQDPSSLPDYGDLVQQAEEVGATSDMSGFSEKELRGLASAFDVYRQSAADMTSYDVMANLWVPQLIAVEQAWIAKGRPRTDDSDKHESVWLRYSRLAHTKAARGKALTVREQLYLDIAAFMKWAEANEPGTELVTNYQALLQTYNDKHQTTPVTLYQ